MVATCQRALHLLLLLLPFYLLLLLEVKAVTFHNDREVLLSLKQSISGAFLSTWNPHSDHCSWYGVSCDAFTARVTSLNLTSGSLSGSLPDSIGYLSELKSLIILCQGLSGQIPAAVGNLRRLEVLNLHGNNFSGNLPEQIIQLSSLLVLNLSSNSLSGEMAAGLIGSGQLQVIDLSNNMFTGEIRIENSSKCDTLRHLKLSNNLLEKEIPGQLGKCGNLRTLLLDGNILQGRVPPELGRLSELRILDVSTNSLTETIPKELGKCKKLSVVVLTNSTSFVGEQANEMKLDFNAFDGGIPHELLTLPSLQILWAPRANFKGRLPGKWSASACSLKVLHLGLNSLEGAVPPGLGMTCKNLTFLDLSSNRLMGYLPASLALPCMMYFNVSRNNISGGLPSFQKASGSSCDVSLISFEDRSSFLHVDDILVAYFNIPVWGPQISTYLGSAALDQGSTIVHDFSYNQLGGLLPSFFLGDEFFVSNAKNGPEYTLSLNRNMLNGSIPNEVVANCSNLRSFSIDLSGNCIAGEISESLFLKCTRMKEFNAAHNEIGGSLASSIGNLTMLQSLDLRGNRLSGSLPTQLGSLNFLKSVLLGRNSLSGEIPQQLGQLTSVVVLDLSHNDLTGSIPTSLANSTSLEIVLLNNNWLSGEIPTSLSTLPSLEVLNVSYNNLTGNISFRHLEINCDWFRGNDFFEPCSVTGSPPGLQLRNGDGKLRNDRNKKSLIVVVVIAVSVVLCVTLVAVISMFWKRKFCRLSSLKGKVAVTFADAPAELTYENVVRATGNFSIKNLIGTGGFGSTYKAELFPGYLVAVKRLSIGRLQGAQQFDAEIRTLGRIRHKNLVTLIGYYVGEAEMFLIYNYLSGGNLENFIRYRSGTNVQWPVICKIALDIAQALAYLHYSCIPRVLHRDIKPSNILLDEELNAYLSDFGLARLIEVSKTHATTDVAGTFGYVAPEYATMCRVSDKSDVYSFGVVLLELISGKKSLDPSFAEYGDGFNIVTWAKLLIKEGRSSELFSRELWEAGPQQSLLQMLKLASTCTVESLSVRPSMKQVLGKLKQLKSS